MEGVAITANTVTESTIKSGTADSPIDSSSPGLTYILEDLMRPSSVFDAAHIEDQIQTREDHSAQKSLIQRDFDISSSSESDQERNEKAVPASKIKPSNGTKQAHLQTGPKGCVPGKSTASATVATKKKKRASEEKSKSGGSRGGKKTKASAHQKNLSLAEAHLSVSLKKQELQQGFLYDQLAFNKQKWAEEKADKALQLRLDCKRREQETVSRKASERHQFFIALVEQGKSTTEIKELLEIYDASA